MWGAPGVGCTRCGMHPVRDAPGLNTVGFRPGCRNGNRGRGGSKKSSKKQEPESKSSPESPSSPLPGDPALPLQWLDLEEQRGDKPRSHSPSWRSQMGTGTQPTGPAPALGGPQ